MPPEQLAFQGRVVTMDSANQVLASGVVYVGGGAIQAVQSAGEPPPAGFEDTPVEDTGGTVYPGLIELHNHLPYNILRLWQVPSKFTDSDAWKRTAAYREYVSNPMCVLVSHPELHPALIRYVECKCLLGGVTTTQGITLRDLGTGFRRYFRGTVRNVEQTGDAALPDAHAQVVDPSDLNQFWQELQHATCFLLHLSEGIDDEARQKFLRLQHAPGEWMVASPLAGIHCNALQPDDFAILKEYDAKMVWSPFSNLLLYGATARVQEARDRGMLIGLGADWSVSGSKNLLGELKVAHLYSEQEGGLFSARDLLAMATCDAAAILGWSGALGSIEPGKRADLLVIDGQTDDPYLALIAARETAIRLVVVDGVPRYGEIALMQHLDADGERVSIGGVPKTLYLTEADADPALGHLSLAEAEAQLSEALRRLPELANPLPPVPDARMRNMQERLATGGHVWTIEPDELMDPTGDLRQQSRLRTSTDPSVTPALVTLDALRRACGPVTPLTLDSLTVADDAEFLATVASQRNLPQFIKDGLHAYYV